MANGLDSSVADSATKGDNLVQKGEQKTVFNCHHCHKDLVALLDFDINGNHVIECPTCGHEHLRKITNGKITDDRWGSREQRKDEVVKARRVWKHDVLQVQTSSTSEFIRERWLNRMKV